MDGMGSDWRSHCFSGIFQGLAGPRQRGKVIYPLDEVLLLCLLAVLGGAETSSISSGSARRSAVFCVDSGCLTMERQRTITSRHIRDAR